MKKITVAEKIAAFFGKGIKKRSSSSLITQKHSRKKSYTSKYIGSGTRKKSLLEKWRIRWQGREQQDAVLLRGRTENRNWNSFRLCLVLGILTLGAYLLVIGPVQTLLGNMQYFRIHEIEVSGCVMTTPTVLKKFAGISYQLNMLSVDPSSIQTRLEEHPWVDSASIRRIWPDRLSVVIKEYRPRALIVRDNGEGFGYIDSKGKVFATVLSGQEVDFPVITGLGAFATKEEKKKLLDVATLLLDFAALNNPNFPVQSISEIHFSNEGELTLYLVEQPFPIFFGKGEMRWKCYQLRKVLEVLYRKKRSGAAIEKVVYIKMDYQKNKVLVAKNQAG